MMLFARPELVQHKADIMTHTFFVSSPRGTESILADELKALAPELEWTTEAGGVSFSSGLAVAYRVCMWSRVASRVLLPLKTFDAPNPDALYQGVRSIDWAEHLNPRRTLAVRGATSRSAMTNARFISLKTKDGIVDALRAATGSRPDIDTRTPDIQVRVRILEDKATVSLELSARPGARADHATGQAPLRGELAAAVLLSMGWPAKAAEGAPLVDPLCGSTGNFLIEGAAMAMDVAPGLLKPHHGLTTWRGHDARLWNELMREARGRQQPQMNSSVIGLDPSKGAIGNLRKELESLGVPRGAIRTKHQALSELMPPSSAHVAIPPGLLVTSPPYGDRGSAGGLGRVYEELGDLLKQRFSGWTAGILTGNSALAKCVGLKPSRRVPMWSGATECRVLVYPIQGGVKRGEGPGWRKPSQEADMLTNRLRKNLGRLRKWAKRNDVSCYRLYDADIPEYNVAIDWYDGGALVQEYHRPPKIDPEVADRRLRDASLVVPEVLGIAPKDVAIKIRRRQQDGGQYQKLGDSGAMRTVKEGGLSFWVNLEDYLDTGLFLDQRKIRARIKELAKDRAFLNLFAYTCTATVYAAAGGATTTTSVDLSKTYLEWGRRNLRENGFGGDAHRLVQEDCIAWLKRAKPNSVGLIYAAPPTFSRSKRASTFDVQRDHEQLIMLASRLLTPDGVLIFSNPFQNFVLHKDALEGLQVTTLRALPKDFERNPNIFKAWQIERSR